MIPNSSQAAKVENEEPDWGDGDENFDYIYDNNEEHDCNNKQEHGSVLRHLISQVV